MSDQWMELGTRETVTPSPYTPQDSSTSVRGASLGSEWESDKRGRPSSRRWKFTPQDIMAAHGLSDTVE